jgi:hypothetical protein
VYTRNEREINEEKFRKCVAMMIILALWNVFCEAKRHS